MPQDSYNPEFFAHLFAAEDRHFWFRARNRAIGAVVRQLTADLPDGYRVLEIGCGTGNTLRVLETVCTRGLVVGMDLHPQGLRYARQRVSCPLVCGDIHRMPFEPGFDLICLFDVIEHLPDDLRVLCDVQTMLSPAGKLVVTVPAHMSLWSYFDEAAHHCRRYETAGLRTKLRQTGYRVEYLTEYMAALFPLVWLGRRLAGLKNRRGRDAGQADRLANQELRIVPVLNDVLTWLLSQETAQLQARRKLRIGTSLLAVAGR